MNDGVALESVLAHLWQNRLNDASKAAINWKPPLSGGQKAAMLLIDALKAERGKDAESAARFYAELDALGCPMATVLRECSRYFRQQGDLDRALRHAMLLGQSHPDALDRFVMGLPADFAARHAPLVLSRLASGTQPRFYAMRDVKRALVKAAGIEAAGVIVAESLGSAPRRLRKTTLVSLADWAREHGRNHVEIQAAEFITLRGSEVIGRAPTQAITARSRCLFSAVAEDAVVSSKSSYILKDDTVILDYQADELALCPLDFDVDPVVLLDGSRSLHALVPGRADVLRSFPAAFSLLGIHSYAFGHWILEFLPKLWLCMEDPAFAGTPILVDAQMPPQHFEALELFAGESHPIIVVEPGEQVHVGALWITAMPLYMPAGPAGGANEAPDLLVAKPDVLARLYGIAASRIGNAPPGSYPERLYLKRADGLHRKLVNSSEVEELMRARGFAVVDFAELGFRQQFDMIRAARIVIAADGSSHLMTLFARPGTRIAILTHEFIEDDQWMAELAVQQGQELVLLVGETARLHPVYRGFSDYRVPLPALVALVERFENCDEANADRSGIEAGLVSVIIIFLNGEPFMDEAIASVFAQTYPHWELLLCDDGSTDASTKKAKALAALHPGKVRYFEHEGHANKGMSATRNLGIAMARGEFVCMLDADDLYLPERLEKHVAALRQHPEAAMVFGSMVLWYSWKSGTDIEAADVVLKLNDEDDVLIAPPAGVIRQLRNAHGGLPQTSGATMRTALVRSIGGYEAEFTGMYEDEVFFSKMMMTYPAFFLGEILDRYRRHDLAFCNVAISKNEYDPDPNRINPSRERYLFWLLRYATAQGSADVRKAVIRTLRNVFATKSRLLISDGKPEQAVSALRELAAADPDEILLQLPLLRLLLDQNQKEQAVVALRRAASQRVTDATALREAVQLLLSAGEIDPAMQMVSNAEHSILVECPLYRQVAQAALRQKQAALAETWARRGLSFHPDSRELHEALARALVEQSRISDALPVIEIVIGSGPELPGALQLAGRIYSQAGRHADALAAYDRLLAIEPDRPNIAQLRERAARALERQSQQA